MLMTHRCPEDQLRKNQQGCSEQKQIQSVGDGRGRWLVLIPFAGEQGNGANEDEKELRKCRVKNADLVLEQDDTEASKHTLENYGRKSDDAIPAELIRLSQNLIDADSDSNRRERSQANKDRQFASTHQENDRGDERDAKPASFGFGFADPQPDRKDCRQKAHKSGG